MRPTRKRRLVTALVVTCPSSALSNNNSPWMHHLSGGGKRDKVVPPSPPVSERRKDPPPPPRPPLFDKNELDQLPPPPPPPPHPIALINKAKATEVPPPPPRINNISRENAGRLRRGTEEVPPTIQAANAPPLPSRPVYKEVASKILPQLPRERASEVPSPPLWSLRNAKVDTKVRPAQQKQQQATEIRVSPPPPPPAKVAQPPPPPPPPQPQPLKRGPILTTNAAEVLPPTPFSPPPTPVQKLWQQFTGNVFDRHHSAQAKAQQAIRPPPLPKMSAATVASVTNSRVGYVDQSQPQPPPLLHHLRPEPPAPLPKKTVRPLVEHHQHQPLGIRRPTAEVLRHHHQGLQRQQRRRPFALNALPLFLLDQEEEDRAAVRAVVNHVLHGHRVEDKTLSATDELKHHLDEYLEQCLKEEQENTNRAQRPTPKDSVFGLFNKKSVRTSLPFLMSFLRHPDYNKHNNLLRIDFGNHKEAIHHRSRQAAVATASTRKNKKKAKPKKPSRRRVLKTRQVPNNERFLSALHDLLDEDDNVNLEDDSSFDAFLQAVREPDYEEQEYSDYEDLVDGDRDAVTDDVEDECTAEDMLEDKVNQESDTQNERHSGLKLVDLPVPLSDKSPRRERHDMKPISFLDGYKRTTLGKKKRKPLALLDMGVSQYDVHKSFKQQQHVRLESIFVDNEEEELDEEDLDIIWNAEEGYITEEGELWFSVEQQQQQVARYDLHWNHDSDESENLDEDELGLLLESNVVDGYYYADDDEVEVPSGREVETSTSNSELWPTGVNYHWTVKDDGTDLAAPPDLNSDLEAAFVGLDRDDEPKQDPDWGFILPANRKPFPFWDSAPFRLFRAAAPEADAPLRASGMTQSFTRDGTTDAAPVLVGDDEKISPTRYVAEKESEDKSLFPTSINYGWKMKDFEGTGQPPLRRESDSKEAGLPGEEVPQQWRLPNLWLWSPFRRLFKTGAPDLGSRDNKDTYIDNVQTDAVLSNDILQIEEDFDDMSLGESAFADVGPRYDLGPPPPPPQLPSQYQETC